MEQTIAITCDTKEYLPISELARFQGQLKHLPVEELNKLKNSIITYGFSFPIFVWQKNILDGHQRIEAIKSLIEDGYKVGDLPVVEIEAEDDREAAEKLLLINSRYAQISQSGYEDFISEFEVDIEKLQNLLSIPDIIVHETGDLNIDDHYQGMPEYNQDDGVDDPIQTIQLHFYSREDIDRFNQVNGLNITENTQYINYNKPDLDLKKYEYK